MSRSLSAPPPPTSLRPPTTPLATPSSPASLPPSTPTTPSSRTKPGKSTDPWFDRFHNRYDPFVQQRLLRASTLPADQIESAYRQLTATRDLWHSFFQTFDFLILPATPFPPLTKPDCTVENRLRLLTLTAPASLGGLPVLTLPLPLPSGFTTGLQLIVPTPRSPVIPWALSR